MTDMDAANPPSGPQTRQISPRERSRFLKRDTPPHIVTLVLIAGIGALNMNIFLPSLPAMATFSTPITPSSSLRFQPISA